MTLSLVLFLIGILGFILNRKNIILMINYLFNAEIQSLASMRLGLADNVKIFAYNIFKLTIALLFLLLYVNEVAELLITSKMESLTI
ncbi:MAG: hypothetical protein EOP45_00525 [Sphingobacteriaceae bacterium]|nr:MAG: hypothetical protein EOP45_00525 [Sphingobacteriaceae bacterium]